LIKEKSKIANVHGIECPLFVPLIEEGFVDYSAVSLFVEMCAEKLKDKNIDTLLLGCTHYPLLYEALRQALPSNINIINPAFDTALALKQLLINNNMENTASNIADTFYITGDTIKFDKQCHDFLREDIKSLNILL